MEGRLDVEECVLLTFLPSMIMIRSSGLFFLLPGVALLTLACSSDNGGSNARATAMSGVAADLPGSGSSTPETSQPGTNSSLPKTASASSGSSASAAPSAKPSISATAMQNAGNMPATAGGGMGGAPTSPDLGSSEPMTGGAGGTTDSALDGGVSGGSGGQAAGGTGSDVPHPNDAVSFQGHWYKFTQAAISGADAEMKCEQDGGYLVCISSQEENAYVLSLAGENRPWIGLNNNDDPNTYSWVNGSPTAYDDWQPGQPDNPGREHWVKLNDDGTWDDAYMPSSYICEWGD